MKLAIKMFTATDKYAGHALYAVQRAASEYLSHIPSDRVVSIQMQQSTYRDMDGDYPQDMFWYTLLATIRVEEESASGDDRPYGERGALPVA